MSAACLMDLGIQGVEVEDKIPLTQTEKEQMFVDILAGRSMWMTAWLISASIWKTDEDKEKMLSGSPPRNLKEIGTPM